MGDTLPPLDEGQSELASVLPAYTIGGILGTGAFAVVFAGRHRQLDREVAIKVLSPALVADADARDRFAVEARLLASLDHPHIVRVYDYVDHGSVCALVMERMRGGNMAARLKLGRLPLAPACAVMLAALYGLEHAHRNRVLHRDIKPENLLFGEHNLLKVADFGIAKMVGASGARLTATAARLGTPAYMAPEQVSSALGPISPATDVWAAGAVLHELLVGVPPFADARELGDALLRRVTTDPEPVTALSPEVPKRLAEVVMRALEREPQHRYASAREFADALEGAAEQELGSGSIAACGIPIHRVQELAAEPHEPTLEEHSPIDLVDDKLGPAPAPARRRPRRGHAALAAGGLLAAIAAVLILVLSGGDGGRATVLPGPPPGWPKKMMLSYIDQVQGPAGVGQRLAAGGSTISLFDGDAAAGTDWSHDPKRSPATFVRSAHQHGLFPYAFYYGIRAIGRTGKPDSDAPQIRRTLVDPRLMRIYWGNVGKLFRSLGSTGEVAAVTIESGLFPELEQQVEFNGEDPVGIPVRVGDSGLPELKGLPDNLLGFAEAWRTLRTRYAPKVLIGVELDDYGANVDISRELPPKGTLLAAARRVATFYQTVAANDFDYAGLEIAYAEEGQDPSRTDIYSPAEKQGVVDFSREFVRVAQIPLVLDNVPLGNTASRAITDRRYHWRDTWVQWLIGDSRFRGLRELHDAGVIGVVFGVAAGPDETCPCDAAHDGVTNGGPTGAVSTSADDDGGYFASRVAALERAGGLPLH